MKIRGYSGSLWYNAFHGNTAAEGGRGNSTSDKVSSTNIREKKLQKFPGFEECFSTIFGQASFSGL